MSDLELISYRPEPGEYAWTFGGAAPVMRLTPPVALSVYTEDAFAGRVRSETDLVSTQNITGLNPQTGPFYIEGAEPGDTVAVHFVSIEPARDWAASTTVPLFGALTGTHLTALLHEPLEELMWMWQLDRAAAVPVHRAEERLHRGPADGADARHGGRRSRAARGALRRWCPTRSAATWTRRRCARAPPATWASTCQGRCCRSATGTPGRARARPAASRSSAR